MVTTKMKIILSLILSFVIVFTMIPATVLTIAAQAAYPTMMEFTAASSADFHKYWNKVYTVTFLNKMDTDAMSGALESWDISVEKNDTCICVYKIITYH